MIRCNLAVILAEQSLKITKVSKDTGISRTTLTALSCNASQGLQFETLNTLCNYLKITPNDLISYVPYDFEINVLTTSWEGNETPDVKVDLNLIDRTLKVCYCIPVVTTIFSINNGKFNVELLINCPLENPDNLIKALRRIPRPFLIDFVEIFQNKVFDDLGDAAADVSLSWCDAMQDALPNLP